MTDPMRPREPAEGEYTDSELPEDATRAAPLRDHDAEAVSAEHDTEAIEIDADEHEGDVEIDEESDDVEIAIVPPGREFPI
ncbi:hypothetical protein [Agromyces sp. NPDC055658]